MNSAPPGGFGQQVPRQKKTRRKSPAGTPDTTHTAGPTRRTGSIVLLGRLPADLALQVVEGGVELLVLQRLLPLLVLLLRRLDQFLVPEQFGQLLLLLPGQLDLVPLVRHHAPLVLGVAVRAPLVDVLV